MIIKKMKKLLIMKEMKLILQKLIIQIMKKIRQMIIKIMKMIMKKIKKIIQMKKKIKKRRKIIKRVQIMPIILIKSLFKIMNKKIIQKIMNLQKIIYFHQLII